MTRCYERGGVVELVASEPSDQASVHGSETPSPAPLGSATVRPRAGQPVPSLRLAGQHHGTYHRCGEAWRDEARHGVPPTLRRSNPIRSDRDGQDSRAGDGFGSRFLVDVGMGGAGSRTFSSPPLWCVWLDFPPRPGSRVAR